MRRRHLDRWQDSDFGVDREPGTVSSAVSGDHSGSAGLEGRWTFTRVKAVKAREGVHIKTHSKGKA